MEVLSRCLGSLLANFEEFFLEGSLRNTACHLPGRTMGGFYRGKPGQKKTNFQVVCVAFLAWHTLQGPCMGSCVPSSGPATVSAYYLQLLSSSQSVYVAQKATHIESGWYFVIYAVLLSKINSRGMLWPRPAMLGTWLAALSSRLISGSMPALRNRSNFIDAWEHL